jgi:hypothetical protein
VARPCLEIVEERGFEGRPCLEIVEERGNEG